MAYDVIDYITIFSTMARTPGIKDVARLAGVSTATVSRALNNPEAVSPATREAVLRSASEVDYRVNHAARSLRLQKTGAVAVLIPNVGNPFFSNILAGIESIMTQSSINVLLLDTRGHTSQSSLADYLNTQRADGIICLDGQMAFDTVGNDSFMHDLPVVYACEWPVTGVCNSVRSDNAKGARLAIEHLVSLGHKNIGHLAGPVENVLTTERKRATVEALQNCGLKVEMQWFFEGDFGLVSGTDAAKRWLALKKRPSALFCASDLMAIGVMAELMRCGIEVPGDLSLIGFDDIDIARFYTPALTTVRQPTRELGSIAAKALLERLHGRSVTEAPLLDVELIVRKSTVRLNK